MAERCACLRPLGAPDRPHWWPYRDPEPGPDIQVVIQYGDDLNTLRMRRVPGGWQTRGTATPPYPERTGPQPWTTIGRCRAGAQHPVLDATDEAGTAPWALRALHAAMLADLDNVLDTEAGLRAILAAQTTPLPLHTQGRATGTHRHHCPAGP